ncbi:VanZ family protein [Aldersonia sp. NBC_00410]|nr:VanZ family protein [Aldersonia sp. NBC_00410]
MVGSLRSRRAVPFLVALGVTFFMLFSPGSTVPSGPPNSDKLTHLLMFLVLTVTACHAGFRMGAVLIGIAGYAAVSEVLQAVLPIRRSGSVWDWLADLLGILAGLGIVAAWRAHLGRRA